MDLARIANLTNIEKETLQKRMKLFQLAFTHRSAVNEDETDQHNERLEYLGDAVLELAATEYLYKQYPTEPEGVLTNYRSALVKKENLARVTRKLNIAKFLVLSSGEERSGGRNKEYLLANLLEAFIGALYLSAGFGKTKKFIKEYILEDIAEIVAKGDHLEAKSMLQEFTQGAYKITPSYRVLSEKGKDHEKEFHIGAYLEKTCIGKGKGGSKKEAQSAAAEKALETQPLWENDFKKIK